MIYNDALNDIIENVKKTTETITDENVSKMTKIIEEVESIFIMGLGRTG